MAKSVRESISISDGSEPSVHHVLTLVGNLKKVVNFFAVSKDELSQAGIHLRNSQPGDTQNQEYPLRENVLRSRIR